jgi:hypothetical protein
VPERRHFTLQFCFSSNLLAGIQPYQWMREKVGVRKMQEMEKVLPHLEIA